MTVSATTIVLPDTIEDIPVVDFRRELFRRNTSLRSITLPATITAIPAEAFSGCTNLASVTIPAVNAIGNSAFYGCVSLVSIDLPAVTTIGVSAFNDCSNLTKVTLAEGLTSIGGYAFADCRNLTEINVPASLTQFPRAPYESNDNTFFNCQKLPLTTRNKLTSQGYSGRGF